MHQLIHQIIIAATDQAPALSFLPDQAMLHQLGDMMGKGGGGHIQFVLDVPNGHSRGSRLNQQTVDTETMRTAEGLQTGGCVFQVYE